MLYRETHNGASESPKDPSRCHLLAPTSLPWLAMALWLVTHYRNSQWPPKPPCFLDRLVKHPPHTPHKPGVDSQAAGWAVGLFQHQSGQEGRAM